MNECKDCKYFEPSQNMYGDGYCHNTEWLFNEPPVYKDFGCIKFKQKGKEMEKQEMINKLRDIADSMEENDYLCHSENLKQIADELQVTPNPIQDIVELNEKRYGLIFNSEKAIEKLEEELQEFKDAVKDNNEHEMLDALTDIRVIAIGEIRKMGYDPECTLNETVKEISSRKQDPAQKHRWERLFKKQPGEKWLKDKNQSPDTLYKADFNKCKIGNTNENN